MAADSARKQVTTVINTYVTDPEEQDHTVELLVEIAEEVARWLPGFGCMKVLASQDGNQVVTYSRWQSEHHWEEFLRNAEARQRLVDVLAVAKEHCHVFAEIADVEPGEATDKGARRIA